MVEILEKLRYIVTQLLYAVCRWHSHHFQLLLDEMSDAKPPALISEPLQKQRAFLMLFYLFKRNECLSTPTCSLLWAFIMKLLSLTCSQWKLSLLCVCVCARVCAHVCVCVCVCRCACSSITAVCFVRAIITVCISLWRYCSLGWCTMCLISSSSKVRVLWRRFVEHESSTYYDNCFRIRI